MLKLTRLNHQVIAINPDHISWVEASPDTTICLYNGEKHLVRESLDELIERVIEFRRRIRTDHGACAFAQEGDPPRVVPFRHPSVAPDAHGGQGSGGRSRASHVPHGGDR